MTSVKADPYSWPFDGGLTPDSTAFIIIDMQARLGRTPFLDEVTIGLGSRATVCNRCDQTRAADRPSPP